MVRDRKLEVLGSVRAHRAESWVARLGSIIIGIIKVAHFRHVCDVELLFISLVTWFTLYIAIL